jgi:hypothetical protein
MPIILDNFVAAPDLVIDSLSASSDAIVVVVKNVGGAAVQTNQEFWVEVYIDPDPVPTGVNQMWEDLCDEGLRWGVTASALPLAPGEAITLTIGDEYYWPTFSNFDGALAEGTPVYAQADAHNAYTNYGGVLEGHEISGGTYNNIEGTVSTLGVVGARPPIIWWPGRWFVPFLSSTLPPLP